MNAKVLSILVAIVVVVGGLAAYFAMTPMYSSTVTMTMSAKVFPELSEKINDVAVVRVKNYVGEMVVKKTGTGWGLESRGGYPVEFEKVKEALMSLADLAAMTNLTHRLSDEFLDIDLLDQQARDVLGYMRADEIVIR